MLKQRILDGDLLSGQHVWTSELAEEFDVIDIIVDACGKKLLTEWYQRLDVQAQIIRVAIWNIGSRGDKTYEEHRAIIEAMAAMDRKTARKAVKAHLDSIVSDFNQAILTNQTSLGEHGEWTLPHGRRQLKSRP